MGYFTGTAAATGDLMQLGHLVGQRRNIDQLRTEFELAHVFAESGAADGKHKDISFYHRRGSIASPSSADAAEFDQVLDTGLSELFTAGVVCWISVGLSYRLKQNNVGVTTNQPYYYGCHGQAFWAGTPTKEAWLSFRGIALCSMGMASYRPTLGITANEPQHAVNSTKNPAMGVGQGIVIGLQTTPRLQVFIGKNPQLTVDPGVVVAEVATNIAWRYSIMRIG